MITLGIAPAAKHTFLMSPRSPWSASAACMKELAIPRLFIVATIFRPTSPLLPTPHIMSLPPASLTFVTTSTAFKSPSWATGSDWYSIVTCDSAVAAVERTFTARESRRVPSGSVAESGGVSGCTSEPARFRLSEVGDNGSRTIMVWRDAAISSVRSVLRLKESKWADAGTRHNLNQDPVDL